MINPATVINPVTGKHQAVRNIYCVARNYISHAAELGNSVPSEAVFFQKSITSLTTDRVVELPDSGMIHHELEIVVLIGQAGKNITSEKAWEHVAGIALGLDFTDRSAQQRLKERRLPWFWAKSFSNAAFVTSFEQFDEARWQQPFTLTVNDNDAQRGIMAEMVFPIPELLTRLSSRIPLVSGDLLFTGTPDGVGQITDGDRLGISLGNKQFATIMIKMTEH